MLKIVIGITVVVEGGKDALILDLLFDVVVVGFHGIQSIVVPVVNVAGVFPRGT